MFITANARYLSDWRSRLKYSTRIQNIALWESGFWLIKTVLYNNLIVIKYSEIPLLRPPKIKAFYLLKTLSAKLKLFFASFSTLSVYLWLETTFGTVQKWSWRPLLDSPKGGLNIGILL